VNKPYIATYVYKKPRETCTFYVSRETEELTNSAQREVGRRLGERVSDLTFWRNELAAELEKMIQETSLLHDSRRLLEKGLQDLEAPLHIAQECLYHRENRTGKE